MADEKQRKDNMDMHASVHHVNRQNSGPNCPSKRKQGTKIIFT